MSADSPDPTEATAVVPALVRDYRRLLRLFPFAYRRAHGAEMLGHLLDAATPEQSRPARGDVVDLVRAAAREWALAPLGPTAERRRRGAVGVLVVLSVVLGYPAAASVGGAAEILGQGGGVVGVLQYAPLAAAWVLWAVGMLVLAAGTVRVAVPLLGAAAVAAGVLLGGMAYAGASGGGLYPVLSGLGWALGLTALAVAASVHAGFRGLATGADRSGRWARAAAGVGALLPVVAIVRAAADVPAWFPEYASPVTSLGGGPLVAGAAVAVVVMLASRGARQALPVLAGVAAAVVVGRTGLMGSRGLEPMDVVDLGNLWALLAIALVFTAASRWVVNRVDELADARASLRPA